MTRLATIRGLMGTAALVAVATAAGAQEDQQKNLVLWGDDVGQSNISACTVGLMG